MKAFFLIAGLLVQGIAIAQTAEEQPVGLSYTYAELRYVDVDTSGGDGIRFNLSYELENNWMIVGGLTSLDFNNNVDVTVSCLAVDWTTDMATARQLTGDKVALQGNLNPSVLRESPEAVEQGVAEVLASYGDGPGHVFNLGHGITPDVDPDNLAVLVDAVHRLSPEYHK